MSAYPDKTSGKSTKRRSRYLRFLLWVGITLVGLILLSGLVTQTGLFRSWLRDYVVDTVNGKMTGELYIERLDGNLFTNLTLLNTGIVLDSDTILFIKSVHARYDIAALLNGTIQVDSIAIDSVHTLLVQEEDSSLNFMRLVSDDSLAAQTEDDSEPFGYSIMLDNLVLTGTSADVRGYGEMIPRKVRDFNLHLSASYEKSEGRFVVHEMGLVTNEPEYHITSLQVKASADTAKMTITDLDLATISNRVVASGVYYFSDLALTKAHFIADPLSLEEFTTVLPEKITAVDGEMKLEASIGDDTLSVTFVAKQSTDEIDFTASTSPFSSLLDSNAQQYLEYEAHLTLGNVTLDHWVQGLPYSVFLDGAMTFSGIGTVPEQAVVRVTGDLSGSSFEDYVAKQLILDVSYDAGNLEGGLVAESRHGKAQVKGHMEHPFDVPRYSVAVDLSNLDLRKIGLIDTLDTDLNINALIEGSGLSPDSVQGAITLAIAPSRVIWLDADTGYAQIGLTESGIVVDTFTIRTNIGEVAVSGAVDKNESGQLYYSITIDDTSVVASFLGYENIRLNGQISGLVSGSLQRNTNIASMSFDEVAFDDLTLSSLSGTLTNTMEDSSLSATGKIKVSRLETESLELDSVAISGDYVRDSVRGDVFVWHPLVQGHIRGSSVLDSIITLYLDELEIFFGEEQWSLDSDSTHLIIDSGSYSISDLQLISASDSGQGIAVNGSIGMVDDLLITLEAENLKLAQFAQFTDYDFAGQISADLAFTSPIDQPEFKGHVEINEAHLEGYDILGIGSDVSYSGGDVSLDAYIRITESDSLVVNSIVPVLYDSSGISLDDSRDLSFSLLIDSFPISVFGIGDNEYIEEAEGYLDGELKVSRSENTTDVAGSLSVKNGRVVSPQFGIEYHSIWSYLSFLPNRISLDSLSMIRDKGKFIVTGDVEYDSTLLSGHLRSFQMDLDANKFYIVRHRDYEVQLTSDVQIDGNDSAAEYGGSIVVNRSRFYLPAIIEGMSETPTNDLNLPLLVSATHDDITDSLITDSELADTLSSDSLIAKVMRSLSGRIKVTLPKNTWIKSPELSLELAGDLDIVQESSEPELFGDIRVVRGHYDLYGRRFKVVQGKLVFQGGPIRNPGVNLEATYSFRTPAREKRSLRMYITGNVEVPVIAFTLDDTKINEGDAVSYIVFGRSLDELNQSQQSALGKKSGVGQVASRMLAGQLAGALGGKLNLDIMEIKAGDDFGSAAIVIGKYLTNDLFMSYQRNFGSSTDDDLEPEIVTLEFQITRLLYLQLTEGDAEEAGFDVIVKFEKD